MTHGIAFALLLTCSIAHLKSIPARWIKPSNCSDPKVVEAMTVKLKATLALYNSMELVRIDRTFDSELDGKKVCGGHAETTRGPMTFVFFHQILNGKTSDGLIPTSFK